jgi:hypothetical protein
MGEYQNAMPTSLPWFGSSEGRPLAGTRVISSLYIFTEAEKSVIAFE